jgi:hypothetical protein
VATLAAADSALWGGASSICVPAIESCEDRGLRQAQTNAPSGTDLVFDTYAHLSAEDENGCPPEGATCTAEAAYRYDSESEELTWISRPAAGVPKYNEGRNVELKSALGSRTTDSAQADFEDTSRSISNDGRDVIFETSERLSPYAEPGSGSQVYLWHEGEVSLISSGRTTSNGAVLSASGGDIFFATATQLVPQDGDELSDVYDARICSPGGAAGECGGIEPSPAEPSCFEEACQGPLSSLVAFGPPGSEVFTAGLNVPLPSNRAVSASAASRAHAAVAPAARRRRAHRAKTARGAEASRR